MEIKSVPEKIGSVEDAQALSIELQSLIDGLLKQIGDLGHVEFEVYRDLEGSNLEFISIQPINRDSDLPVDHYDEFDSAEIDKIKESLKKGSPVMLTDKVPLVQSCTQLVTKIAQMAEEQNPALVKMGWQYAGETYPRPFRRANAYHLDGWNNPEAYNHVQFTFGGAAPLEVVKGTFNFDNESEVADHNYADTHLVADWEITKVTGHLIHIITHQNTEGFRSVMTFA